MSEYGGTAGEPPRSRLADYAESTEEVSAAAQEPAPSTEPPDRPAAPTEPAGATIRRREFAAVLGEFRRTAVLVPLATDAAGESSLLTGDLGGVRWIFAFSNEQALARFAVARGEGAREWPYRRVLGARLLDVAVPAAGVPCGVALDCADGPDGVVFPPVTGIVPDAAAVDTDGQSGGAS
ncbi:hypothetical protein H9Y04_06045 [Streptomyces sp. TRM66268-LWL]|uniref:SseB protein N-terminal domain-containing protein n=1 Tax=Streptomyces polyasparticus TaxID=2767826 RepID=A0ABR7S9I7_9ACTN|nr:hypothetical protein [Streptomyces polyasparticus]MBC9712130.1 hypothetical protein [Streptomyces polyasparticus]